MPVEELAAPDEVVVGVVVRIASGRAATGRTQRRATRQRRRPTSRASARRALIADAVGSASASPAGRHRGRQAGPERRAAPTSAGPPGTPRTASCARAAPRRPRPPRRAPSRHAAAPTPRTAAHSAATSSARYAREAEQRPARRRPSPGSCARPTSRARPRRARRGGTRARNEPEPQPPSGLSANRLHAALDEVVAPARRRRRPTSSCRGRAGSRRARGARTPTPTSATAPASAERPPRRSSASPPSTARPTSSAAKLDCENVSTSPPHSTARTHARRRARRAIARVHEQPRDDQEHHDRQEAPVDVRVEEERVDPEVVLELVGGDDLRVEEQVARRVLDEADADEAPARATTSTPRHARPGAASTRRGSTARTAARRDVEEDDVLQRAVEVVEYAAWTRVERQERAASAHSSAPGPALAPSLAAAQQPRHRVGQRAGGDDEVERHEQVRASSRPTAIGTRNGQRRGREHRQPTAGRRIEEQRQHADRDDRGRPRPPRRPSGRVGRAAVWTWSESAMWKPRMHRREDERAEHRGRARQRARGRRARPRRRAARRGSAGQERPCARHQRADAWGRVRSGAYELRVGAEPAKLGHAEPQDEALAEARRDDDVGARPAWR